MASESTPRLYTIPSGAPFLDALAGALLSDPALGGALGGLPAELADVTILLPTRRAARALGEAFLRAGGGKALLLPRIRPLGDVDEEELVLDPGAGAAEMGDAGDALALPPAIPPLERQMLLARLILKWGEANPFGPRDPAQAVRLAAELGRFLDAAETERVDLAKLKDLVPADYAENWQITLEFLTILTAHWPEILAERGVVDPAARRNALLAAQAQAWAASAPAHPVIAAGSTGSIPAAADLLGAVARLPNGAVVLPGLDLALDDRAWNEIDASHPQFGMKELIARLGATRTDVMLWPNTASAPVQSARAHLVSEALRPWKTTERWRDAIDSLGTQVDDALDGLSLVEAPTPREEAAAIALMLRGALETPGYTAALVTPDRKLARRVAMELRRWGIEIDDSAGVPLDRTPPVAFLRLVAEAAIEDLAPVALLALLKHPLAAGGMEPASLRRLTRTLEAALLRGPRPDAGVRGLRAALRQAQGRAHGDAHPDWAGIRRLIDRLARAFKPLTALIGQDRATFADLVQAHVQCTEQLAAAADDTGATRLWAGEAGEAAAIFVAELMEAGNALPEIDPFAYPALFDTLAAPRVVRPRYGRHPRLFIWGPLEARLQHADLIVLGGLNEGTWPAEAVTDPWLSRPMRQRLGLAPPERRIGLAAHDFAQGAAARHVCLTRPLKVDGAPTVASRWLLRLQNLLKGAGAEARLEAAQPWLAWQDALDRPEAIASSKAPRPCPPLKARPDRLSVTEIETLIRDPYAIYARKILRLAALDPIDAEAGAAERGTIIHAALEQFVKAYPDRLPDDVAGALIEIGEKVFRDAPDRPGVAAFWWPRFCEVAEWMADFERETRAGLVRVHAETRGELVLADGLARPTTLVAKADRIEQHAGGSLAILDYKTGMTPSRKQVEVGLSPQLPLEAAIAAAGGFDGLESAPVSELAYLRLTGGDPPGEHRPVADLGAEDGAALGVAALDGLRALLRTYELETTPYLSRPRPMFIGRAGAYDHLARVREWSAGVAGEAEV